MTLDRKYAKEILNSVGLKQAVTDKDRACLLYTSSAQSMRRRKTMNRRVMAVTAAAVMSMSSFAVPDVYKRQ